MRVTYFLVALALLLPATASAERIPKAKPVEISTIPLKAEELKLQIDPMRRAKPWPASEGGGAVPGRIGEGPVWKLLEDTIDESKCRTPVLSRDGAVALVLCPGWDVSRPEDEHVFFVREGKLGRYRTAVAPGTNHVALSADGKRFALVVEEGSGGRTVHLIDLEKGTDTRLGGGWNRPGQPMLAADADVVAFPARVGGDPSAVLVDLGANQAWLLERSRKPVSVWGINQRGRKVLITADTQDKAQLQLLDIDKSTSMILSNRKGAVTSAALHPSGDAAAFSAELGGLGVLYWADVSERKRDELLNSVDSRYTVLSLEKARRQILYSESGQEQPYKLFDRRKKTDRYTVLKGCDEPALSEGGTLMAVRCPKARMGAAVYLFVVPEPEE